MDSLQFLIDKGLIKSDNRPIKPTEPIKIVNNGVIFQCLCHNGLRYDIAVSWLQKAIRRGLTEQAYYCAYHIAELGKIFRSHLLNRLITILSEDIGPAEPLLAPVIEKLYFEARTLEEEGSLHQMQVKIIEIITYLSEARKSRICDWLIHDCDKSEEPGEEFDTLETLVHWAVVACDRRSKCTDEIKVFYKRDGAKYTSYKQLQIYEVWMMLLDYCDKSVYLDVVSLLRLFIKRGPQYGLLHVIHAITLCFIGNPVNVPVLPAILPKWTSFADLDFPILDAAVDKHTSYGRKYLGRSFVDFIHHGAKLVNWTPLSNEQELIDKFEEKLEIPEVEDSKPRPYQETLVKQSVDKLKLENSGWLLMACGTGKTKTSYWIMKKILDAKPTATRLFIVITPFLEILRQFYKCWSAMNRMHKVDSITGIMASCTDTFPKDKFSNFEYINSNNDALTTFLGYPNRVKFIYTTYASLPKLLSKGIKPDLVVYDEAHHIKACKMFHDGYELFLTATPHKSSLAFGNVLGRYNLRNAIDDGFLTKYKVGVFQLEDIVDCLIYVQDLHKKTIVYCRTKIIAKNFYLEWIMRGASEENSFYVDCKTNKKDRKRIFDAYRKAKNAVIFNCAILGEGVDFTDCDSILIHSGYTSPTRVVQAVGRPLRLNDGKLEAGVYMMDDGRVSKRLDGMALYDPIVKTLVEYLY
jgi:superfamily II DNA or RNA helicase